VLAVGYALLLALAGAWIGAAGRRLAGRGPAASAPATMTAAAGQARVPSQAVAPETAPEEAKNA
jgi:hypothetical protein